jgi:hypothetical protein
MAARISARKSARVTRVRKLQEESGDPGVHSADRSVGFSKETTLAFGLIDRTNGQTVLGDQVAHDLRRRRMRHHCCQSRELEKLQHI